MRVHLVLEGLVDPRVPTGGLIGQQLGIPAFMPFVSLGRSQDAQKCLLLVGLARNRKGGWISGIDMVNFPWDILNLKESTSFIIRYVSHPFSDGAIFVYDFLMYRVW